MSELGLASKPRISLKYPHMLEEDTEIWRRFITLGDYVPDVVWYDVRVGSSVHLDKDQPEWMIRMADKLTRKRIDVVGKVGSSFWVIELKPIASYDCFGQVIYYAYDFQREYVSTADVVPVIITDFADPDILPICSVVGVLVLEVGGPVGATEG